MSSSSSSQQQQRQWVLPSGAQDIVQNLAAQRIFELELQDIAQQQTCCLSRDQESRLLALVSQFPSVCQTQYCLNQNEAPQYPLLTILKLQPTVQLTKAVVRAFPAALEETQQGFRPIDLACWKGASVEVVQFLHQCNPRAIATQCKGVMHPLHIALHHGTNQDVVEFLISVFPQATRKPDAFGKYPLHHACNGATQASLSVIQRLIRLAPLSLIASDAQGWTPLHHACRHGRSNANDNLALIKTLVSAAPVVLHRPNALGNSPLKMAAMYQTPEVLEYLLQQEQVVDDDDDQQNSVTLLHLAARVNRADTVGYLANRFPEMLTAQSPQSHNTPLHYACERTDADSFRVVRALLKMNHALLDMRNQREQSPLCVATATQPEGKAARFLKRRQQEAQPVRSLQRSAQSFDQ